ncbi:DegV family protein [Vagococcus coleopterorum]|uniref:DegV family protein n=1 Tax=Vagococcus coleopterorum TaxID=2714946 RepID=A0A6G8ANS0_9ENTE|nr:DegV family protein [Vagococcus coleopterorum]QIL46619.1 DegV family protein [Vagococcus coleopterorum]
MSKVKIVTDSSCNMVEGLAKKLNIEIISLSTMIDGVIYKDMDLTGKEFMTMMEGAEALPKTSQPPIGEFVELYDKLGEDGSDIVSIHMTDLISGTVNTAEQAAQISQSNVTVINSHFTDQGLAFQVIEAAEMAEAGATAEEIIAKVENVRENTELYIGVASLDNMVKGGRLSRATGVITNLFNIRVVMQVLPESMETLVKGRGAKAFTKWFNELKETLANEPAIKKIAITHADGLETVTKFKEELQTMYPDMEIPVLDASSIIATHTGKGAFAIMFYKD